jgi:hypothetical protein
VCTKKGQFRSTYKRFPQSERWEGILTALRQEGGRAAWRRGPTTVSGPGGARSSERQRTGVCGVTPPTASLASSHVSLQVSSGTTQFDKSCVVWASFQARLRSPHFFERLQLSSQTLIGAKKYGRTHSPGGCRWRRVLAAGTRHRAFLAGPTDARGVECALTAAVRFCITS